MIVVKMMVMMTVKIKMVLIMVVSIVVTISVLATCWEESFMVFKIASKWPN